jgi:5-methylcytosine-specific restriction endonuclease McrA
MSGRKQKSLKEMEEELESQRESARVERLGIGRFSGSPSSLNQSLAGRQFHELTPDRMERREAMNQPYQSHIAAPVQSGISSALLLSRMNTEAIEKQARFFALLESKYGAIKGNDKSYEDAINRHLDDEEAMHLESQERMETQKQRSDHFKGVQEKLKKEREGFRPMQQVYNALFQRNYKGQSGSREEQEAQERQQRYEEEHRRRQQEQWEDMQRAQREWEQYQRQQQGRQQHSYAHGGPAQEPPPPSGKRPKMQRNKALAFMGIDPRTAPTARDIKLAFNRRLLQLHPDKNLGNGEKTASKFKRMRKAYNSLTNKGQSDSDTSGSMGGSTLRQNRNGHRTRKNTSKK